MKILCGSQSSLQTVLSCTCLPYHQGWPLGLHHHHAAAPLGMWAPRLCQGCVSSAGVRTQGSGCQHPLGSRAALHWCSAVAVRRPSAVTQRRGGQKEQPMHKRVREGNRTKSVHMFLTDTIFFSEGNTNKPGKPKKFL